MKNRLILACIKLMKILRTKRFSNKDPSLARILIVSTTGLGDTIWATPALRAIKKQYPAAFIGVLTSSVGAQVLKSNPYIDKMWVINFNLPSLIKLIKTLRSYRFETAVLFHTSQRLAPVIAYLSNPHQLIGFKGAQKGLDSLLTHMIKPLQIHEIDKRLELLKPLHISSQDKHLEIHFNESEKKQAYTHIHQLIGEKKDSLWIILHPGAKDTFKQWPTAAFIELGFMLTSTYSNLKILLTGTSEEKNLTDPIASKLSSSVNLAGKLSIKEMCALLSMTDLTIIGDTGPMHLSCAMKTPTLALFCATDHHICGPYHVAHAHVLQKEKTCTPCLKKKCRDPFCLLQISPKAVFNKARELLISNPNFSIRGL